MDIPALILEFLNENGFVIVPKFGVFSLEKTPATFDEKTKMLLPPAKQIVFNGDSYLKDDTLAQFIASKEGVLATVAQANIEETVRFWNERLASGDAFVIENFGRLVKVGENIIFQGGVITKNTPDFYGLESIDIQKINRFSSQKNKQDASRKFIWGVIIFVVIIILVLLAIFQPHLLFGKASPL